MFSSLWGTSTSPKETITSVDSTLPGTEKTELVISEVVESKTEVVETIQELKPIILTVAEKKEQLKKACETGDDVTMVSLFTDIKRKISPDDYEEYMKIAYDNNKPTICAFLFKTQLYGFSRSIRYGPVPHPGKSPGDRGTGRRGQDRLRCRNGQNSGGPHGRGPCHRPDRGRNARPENGMHGEGSGRNHPCASDTGGSDAGGIFQSNGHVFARVIGHGPGSGRSQYVWETGQVAFKSGAKDQPRAREQITGFWELSIGRG